MLAVVEGIVISQLMTKASSTSVAATNVPLTIESPTAGDRVFVDGREVGVTPFKVSVLSAAHAIRVVARESATPAPPVPAAPPWLPTMPGLRPRSPPQPCGSVPGACV